MQRVAELGPAGCAKYAPPASGFSYAAQAERPAVAALPAPLTEAELAAKAEAELKAKKEAELAAKAEAELKVKEEAFAKAKAMAAEAKALAEAPDADGFCSVTSGVTQAAVTTKLSAKDAKKAAKAKRADEALKEAKAVLPSSPSTKKEKKGKKLTPRQQSLADKAAPARYTKASFYKDDFVPPVDESDSESDSDDDLEWEAPCARKGGSKWFNAAPDSDSDSD